MDERGTEPDAAQPQPDNKGLLARVLADSSDAITINSAEDGRYLYVNAATCEALGLRREELLQRSGLGVVTNPQQAGALTERIRAAGSVSHEEVTFNAAGGGVGEAELSAHLMVLDDVPAILAIARLSAPSRDDEVALREAILEAVAFVASAFLRADSWSDAMDAGLGRLAEAAGAQRAYLYENVRPEGEPMRMRHRFEWNASGIEPSGQLGLDYPYFPNFARWAEIMEPGGVIRGPVTDFPEQERRFLEADGVRSTVAVPVYVGDAWWGFVGFDYMETERGGTQADIDALHVAAETLGAAIEQESLQIRLETTELTHRNLIERLPGVVYIESLAEGSPDVYLSPQYEELYGEAPELRLNRPNVWRELIHPDDLPEVLVASANSSATNQPFFAEYRICRSDGTIRWVRDESVVVEDAAGVPLYWLGLVTDLTEQREAEQARRAAEERFRVLVEHIPVATYIENADYSSEGFYISPQIEDITGYAPARFVEQGFWESTLHPEDRDMVLAEEARTIREDEPFKLEYRVVHADGHDVWIREESSILEAPDGRKRFQGVMMDVTERKAAERALSEAEALRRLAEERYRVLVERIPVAPYVEALDGTLDEFYIGPQIERITGWTPEAFAEEEFWSRHLHPDDRDRVMAEVRRTEQTGEPFAADYRFERPDGTYVWIREESQEVAGVRGERLSQGVMGDITQRKEAEEALRAAEERYRMIVEKLPVITYQETVPSGGYPAAALTYVSPRFAEVVGFGGAELESQSFWDRVVHPDDRERVVAASAESVAAGKPATMEYRVVTQDGRTLWFQDRSVLTETQDDGTQIWHGVLIDVTERAKAEEQSNRVGRILHAVATAAERFLTAPDWREEMHQTLKDLGEATGMSRSYLFEIRVDDEGAQRGWETFEWCAPGVASTIDNPENQAFPLDEEDLEWRRKLESGQTAYGVASDYSEGDQEYFEREGIKSVLAVPVLIEGRWWGHLGFDDCFEERSWTEGEIESLRAAGGILSAAIERHEATRRLEESESAQRELIETLPGVVYMTDPSDPNGIFYVSPQYESFFGYSPEERIADPGLWESLVHPDDRDRVLELSQNSHEAEELFAEEYRIFSREGELKWVRDEAVLVRTVEGEPRYWLGLILDITERRRAEEDLRRRDAILAAVGFAAGQLLDSSRWQDPMDEILRELGEAGEASRCYLFRNEVGADDRTRATLTHEWTAAGIDATRHDPRMRDMLVGSPSGEGIPTWAVALAAGSVVKFDSVQTLEDDAERKALLSQGVLSLLEVPVFAGGDWWGWLGFDDCTRERSWSQVEVGALQAAAGLLGAVVHRMEAETQLRHSEERQRLLVERMPAVVYIDAIDELSTSIYCSPQIEDLFGYTVDEWMEIPTLWWDALHPEDRDRVMKDSLRTNETLETFRQEYRIITKDGAVKWVLDESVPAFDSDGNPLHWQGVMFDITDRKQAEEELERTLRLEREAVERLQALDEMKNTFLTAVSHDLRTPLAAVLGLALTLAREDIELDPQETRDLAHRIAMNSRKLDRLVTDLLDLDRLSRGIVEPKLSSTDIGLLVRKAVADADFLSAHNVNVEADTVEVRVDTAKVERIIENLLANTARHTPAGTDVWVRAMKEGNGALIIVEDDGPGVPPSLRQAVFEPFRQGGEELSHSPGVGIGLSLVARFAELHGGHAWVAEREGGGASFRVFLPDADASTDAGATAERGSGSDGEEHSEG